MNGLVGKTKDSFEKQRKLLYTLINTLVRQEKWKNIPLKNIKKLFMKINFVIYFMGSVSV